MHPEAFQWVERFATEDSVDVLDVGGRDINGTTRDLFPNARYLAVDLRDGPGVDVVADFVEWSPPQQFDVVLCTEVFEHTESWPQIVVGAFAACRPGGQVIFTCAGPGRAEHSAVDGAWGLKPGEWYRNVSTGELAGVLSAAGFVDVVVDQYGFDSRAVAVRPKEEATGG